MPHAIADKNSATQLEAIRDLLLISQDLCSRDSCTESQSIVRTLPRNLAKSRRSEYSAKFRWPHKACRCLCRMTVSISYPSSFRMFPIQPHLIETAHHVDEFFLSPLGYLCSKVRSEL